MQAILNLATALVLWLPTDAPDPEMWEHRLGHNVPFALAEEAHYRSAQQTAFYRVGLNRPRAFYAARRWTWDLTGKTQVAWADGRTCPALTAQLEAMETLEPPRPEAPGLGAGAIRPPVPDATFYALTTLSSRFENGVYGHRLSISGISDSPVAKWNAAAMRALKDCWTPEAPAL